LFIKHAGKPGQAWHQDEDFIPTRDRSLTAAWIALDDATIDNGCLWAIPGSHRSGVLWPLRRHANPEYDSIPESFDFPHQAGDARPIEVAIGTDLPGYGKVRSIEQHGQAWVVKADRGSIE